MEQIVYQGRMYSEFEGFDQDAIFKMNNGTYWVQEKYRYWYHYAYRPEVVITQENGRYMMFVAGQSIQVKRLQGVIESKIDGTFKGWDGKSVYKLMNGQTWKQKTYKYQYKYAYRPNVIIAEVRGSYIMQVQGTRVEVIKVR